MRAAKLIPLHILCRTFSVHCVTWWELEYTQIQYRCSLLSLISITSHCNRAAKIMRKSLEWGTLRMPFTYEILVLL